MLLRSRYVLAALAAVSLLTAAACGGDGNGQPSATDTPTEAPAATATPWPGSTQPFVITPNPAPQPRDDYGLIVDARVAAHTEEGGFNRFVLEFAYGRPPGNVEYVSKDRIVGCGSGLPVPLNGDAFLVITLQSSAQHTVEGNPTNAPRELTSPGPSILEAKNICDFEAVVQWAIGTSGKLPFRVSYLEGPPRIVIDVKNP